MFKRVCASSLILILLFPTLAGAVLQFVPFFMAGGGGFSGGIGTFAVLSAFSVGGVLAFIGLGGSQSSPATSPIQVQINAAEPLPTPAGWSNPVAPSVAPVPPSTSSKAAPPSGRTLLTSPPTNGTLAQCTQLGGPSGSYYYESGANYVEIVAANTPSVSGFVNVNTCPASPNYYVNQRNIPACAAGYVISGASCALSNASIVVKPSDGICTIKRVGNTFSNDALDPDCISMPSAVTVGSTEISLKTSPLETQKVKINGDGSTTTTSTVINSNNTTTTTTINVSSGGTIGGSTITGIGTTTVNGAGDLAGQGTLPSTSFPTDYNREATQQSIKSGIDSIKQQTDGSAYTVPDSTAPAAKSSYDTAVSAHKAKIDELTGDPLPNRGITFSFSPTIPSTTCFEPTMTFAGRTIVVTWCEKIGLLREVLGYVFFIMTGFAIYNLVVRDKET